MPPDPVVSSLHLVTGDEEPGEEGEELDDLSNAQLLKRWQDDETDGFSHRDLVVLTTLVEDFGAAKVLGMLAEILEEFAEDADAEADQRVGRACREFQARAALWLAQSQWIGKAAADSLKDEEAGLSAVAS